MRKPIVVDSRVKARAIAWASLEKKASNVLILHVAKLTSVADYLVICSGDSERQVKAIADNIDAVLSKQHQHPLSVEGTKTAQWILMDFGDVVTHVFKSDIRHHYGLERLWRDATRLRLPTQAVPLSARRVVKPKTERARRQA